MSIGLRRKLAVGLAFFIQYRSHGPQGEWYVCGDEDDCEGLLLWEHKPNEIGAKTREEREKDADSFLDTYNAWANGDCAYYSVVKVETDEEGKEVETDLESCGGFIGPDYDYMFGQISDAIQHEVNKQPLLFADDVEVEFTGDNKWLADYHSVNVKTPAAV